MNKFVKYLECRAGMTPRSPPRLTRPTRPTRPAQFLELNQKPGGSLWRPSGHPSGEAINAVCNPETTLKLTQIVARLPEIVARLNHLL